MLKLGVWRKEQFHDAPPPGLFARLHYLLSKSRVSLHLLRMPASPSAEETERFERLMPHVRLSSGVYRTTYRARFRDLDAFVNPILIENFSSSQELRVEDWAASTCLTSREWVETLFPLFPHLRFVASDILLFLAEIEDPRSHERFVFEPDGHLLQYSRPPFVIRVEPPEPWAFPLNRLLSARAVRRWKGLVRFSRPPDSWADPVSDDRVERNGYILRKLPLIHPEAVRLARQDRRFTIRRHSVFEALQEPCEVIRSMNVFNRAYFSEVQLTEGARCVITSLVEGGIWIVGRTIAEDPPAHEVTIFQKQSSGRVTVLKRLGPGSEIEAIALAAS